MVVVIITLSIVANMRLSLLILTVLFTYMSAGSQSLPLLFDFENPPVFQPQFWTLHPNLSGSNGRIEIVNDPDTGNYYAVLSKQNDSGGMTQSAIDLKLNISSWAGLEVDFSFDFNYFFNETQFNDAVFMSDNGGVSFKRVLAMQPSRWCQDKWMRFPAFDFNALLANNGLSYSSNFVIRFVQEGTGDLNSSGDEDGLLLDNIRFDVRQPLQPATLPLAESFATGELNPFHWRIMRSIPNPADQILPAGITPSYYVSIINGDAVDNDNYSLALGKIHDCGGETSSYLDLHLNLLNMEDQQLLLSFAFKHFYDETQFADALWLSDDGGQNFVRGIALEPSRWENNIYGSFQSIWLNQLIDSRGLSHSSNFVIRFNQIGTGDFNTSGDEDGMIIDDVRIDVLAPVTYKLPPFCDNFENSDYEAHWRFGTAELTSSGQATNGTNPASLAGQLAFRGVEESVGLALGNRYDSEENSLVRADMHVDFNLLRNAVLSFALFNHYNENQAQEGLYLSIDGGDNFTKIYTFDWPAISNNNYTLITLPLDVIAANNGLSLSAETILRFQYYGAGDFSTSGDEDGMILDNVCISGIVVADDSPSLDERLQLWPNPVVDLLQLALPTAEKLVIRLTDAQGREVLRQELREAVSTHSLDMRRLPAGMYGLQLQHSQGTVYRKLIKQ
jgi:hypothetical protein